jgi:hypothetical protein
MKNCPTCGFALDRYSPVLANGQKTHCSVACRVIEGQGKEAVGSFQDFLAKR